MNNTNTAADDLYTFRPYDSQLPIEVPQGQRVAKCLYKAPRGKTEAPWPNEYILVPTAHLSDSVLLENIERLLPYISTFLQEEEDRLIKEAHKKHSKGFGASWFSLDNILAALDEAGKSRRLKKEDIVQWFEQYMREPLELAFVEKLGASSNADLAKVEAIVEAYKAKFGSLAGGKTFYKQEDREALLRALDITGANTSEIGRRLQARLEGMKDQKDEDLLAAL